MHFGNGVATRCRDVAPEVGGARCSDLNSTRFLRRLIEAERPDLIAFTGAWFAPPASPLLSQLLLLLSLAPEIAASPRAISFALAHAVDSLADLSVEAMRRP